jgi:hypothetical protein
MEMTIQANKSALAYLAKLGEHYQQSYTVAIRLSSSYGNQCDRDSLLRDLQDSLAAIAIFEDEHIDDRKRLLSAGTSKSAEINQELGRVRTLIEKVLQAVATAESAALAARSKLAPQLDERTKARQVKEAYEAANNGG